MSPVAIIQGRFCAATEQFALGWLDLAATDTTPRERALRVATDWLAGLINLDILPEELAASVEGARSWITVLREPDCSMRDVGVFVCSVLQTAILATQYETAERLAARHRFVATPAEGPVH